MDRLKKNFSTLFWVKAFLNLKTYNIVSSLFYIQRGLHISDLFLLGIIWAITSLISEVPSSYLADKWGRKKTILLGVCFSFIHWSITLFADSFIIFGISYFFYSLSFSMISGTDEALLYDSHKELGDGKSALDRLGKLISAERFFKVATVLLAVFLVKDLLPWQFNLLIIVDIVATVVALGFALRLEEPKHTMDVEKMESGIFIDGVRLLRENIFLRRAMIGKTLIFIATFIPWRFHDTLFTHLGIPVVWFGIAWALYQGTLFLSGFYIKHILPSWSLNRRINLTNRIAFTWIVLFIVCWYVFPAPYLLLVCYVGFEMFGSISHPWYGKIFHTQSASFNRATTISLTNFLKGVFDIPLLGIAAILSSVSPVFSYYLACGIVCIVLLFFSLPKWKEIN